MIKSEKGKHDMPGQEEADEEGKILDLDPHLDELSQGYAGSLILDREGG
jgi:hypothetical protein